MRVAPECVARRWSSSRSCSPADSPDPRSCARLPVFLSRPPRPTSPGFVPCRAIGAPDSEGGRRCGGGSMAKGAWHFRCGSVSAGSAARLTPAVTIPVTMGPPCADHVPHRRAPVALRRERDLSARSASSGEGRVRETLFDRIRSGAAEVTRRARDVRIDDERLESTSRASWPVIPRRLRRSRSDARFRGRARAGPRLHDRPRRDQFRLGLVPRLAASARASRAIARSRPPAASRSRPAIPGRAPGFAGRRRNRWPGFSARISSIPRSRS